MACPLCRCDSSQPTVSLPPAGSTAPTHTTSVEPQQQRQRRRRQAAAAAAALTESQLLCCLAAHAHIDVGQQLLPRDAVLVLLRQLADHAQRDATWHDGGLRMARRSQQRWCEGAGSVEGYQAAGCSFRGQSCKARVVTGVGGMQAGREVGQRTDASQDARHRQRTPAVLCVLSPRPSAPYGWAWRQGCAAPPGRALPRGRLSAAAPPRSAHTEEAKSGAKGGVSTAVRYSAPRPAGRTVRPATLPAHPPAAPLHDPR